MLDDFLVRAALAGGGVALAAAPLGCFAIWRRMAYFSDATAHAAILGVALSLALSLPIFLGAVIVALVMALAVLALTERGLAMDAGLGVLSHAALAIGLLAIALVPGARADLPAYLFGDILAVSRLDVGVIGCGAAVVIAGLIWRWQALLASTLSPELAHAAGISPKRESRLLTLGLAIVVAVAIKVVGALLIGALLLIPAAAAGRLVSGPERMALLAAVFGVAASLSGLWASFRLDTPTGPTIVCAAAAIFVLANIVPGRGG